jgi:hypothetical protein
MQHVEVSSEVTSLDPVAEVERLEAETDQMYAQRHTPRLPSNE